MNRILSFSIALFLLVSMPVASHAAPSSRLDKANAALRDELREGMLEGALEHNVQIHTKSIVFVSRGDGMLASTTVTAFDNVTDKDLICGAVVGFIYVSGFGITPGFYRVYVIVSKGDRTGCASTGCQHGGASTGCQPGVWHGGASPGHAYLLDENNCIKKEVTLAISHTTQAPQETNTVYANADGTSTIDYHKLVESTLMQNQWLGLVIKLGS